MRSVSYAVDEEGYTVAVVEDGRIIHQYRATNNPWDSQGPVMEHGVPVRILQRWAKRTAQEIAAEWGIDLVRVGQDMDLRA